MKLDSVIGISFSPTRTTFKIVNQILKGFKIERNEQVDLTKKSDVKEKIFRENHLVVIGVPVYGGRVPKEAVLRLENIWGNDTPAIIVVVYGNRAYESALHELKNVVVKQGFSPIASAAFIGEHSFSNEQFPIAEGRPDHKDLDLAEEFGWKVKRKFEKVENIIQLELVDVPGELPYKEHMNEIPVSPVSDIQKCVLCGECAEACPVEGISLNGSVKTNIKDCIFCFACIKNCPTGAREENSEETLKIQEWLYTNYKQRKEPEIFL